MSDPIRDSETQSLRPGSDPREIARKARETLNAEHPAQIGPYRILQPLGEGGMGTVYLAEQTKPIHRKVALKIIKLGMDTKQVIARFEAEREALALMNHPNVAKVFDAGATETGRPYFVMEHVAGIPITDYCDKHRLNTEERLRLFMDVCHAAQHAHQKGIIHRDLKPSNVLVCVQDDKPVPKVIDFGVAKATQHRLTERTLYTEQGQLIGTPGYMSPEQAEMSALDIDTRTDIYSLGVILYELLVGALPFEAKSLLQAGFAEIQRIIREVEPQKPSTKLSSLGEASTAVAHNRRTQLRTLAHQIRGDLDWIVMKAMEKDRTWRYDTANGLAMEIQRFLIDEPVLAGPPSAGYRLKKLIRRNKASVAAVVAVVLALVGGLVATSVMYGRSESERTRAVAAELEQTVERKRAEREREQALQARRDAEQAKRAAERARAEAEQVTSFLTDMLAAVNPDKQGREVTVREVLDQAAGTIAEKFRDRPLIEARLQATIGWTYLGLGLYQRSREHLARAIDVYERDLGSDHPNTLSAKVSLASVPGPKEHLAESEAMLRTSLDAMRRATGEVEPQTLRTMATLANNLVHQSRFAEAEALFLTVLESERELYGAEDPRTLVTRMNLAAALEGADRRTDQEAQLREILGIQRRVHGDDHPATLAVMYNLARNLGRQGRHGEAEQLYRRVVDARRRVLGEDHPETLVGFGALAYTLAALERHGEAEPIYRRMLEARRRALGDEHPDALKAWDNLAIGLSEQGRHDEAERELRMVLEIRRRVLGEEHPDTLNSMNNLAVSLHNQDHNADAEALYRRTLELQHRVLGEEHPHTLDSMHNLATSLRDQARYTNAVELHRQTLELRRRVLGQEHPDFALSLHGLAITFESMQLWSEAEPLCRQAAAVWAEVRPAGDSDRLYNGNLLGGILAGLGRHSEAEPLLVESYGGLRDRNVVIPVQERDMLERFVRLYDSWDSAEPGKGYAERSAQWRAQLDEFNAENPLPPPQGAEATSDD